MNVMKPLNGPPSPPLAARAPGPTEEDTPRVEPGEA